MKTYLCIFAAAAAAVFGWLVESARHEGHHCVQHPDDDGQPLPFPDDDVLWLVCDTTDCAHLETPHHRVGDGLVACCWCIRLSPEPKAVRRG